LASGLFIFGLGISYLPSVIVGATLGASTNLINLEHSNRRICRNIKNKSFDNMHPTLIPAHKSIDKH
jgi:hypothetical protein